MTEMTDKDVVSIPESGGPFYPIPECGPGQTVWKLLRGAVIKTEQEPKPYRRPRRRDDLPNA